MHSNCTRKLLNLEDVNIKKIVHADNYLIVKVSSTLTTLKSGS